MERSSNIIATFDIILNEKKCYDLARQCKFIERSSSKLKGHEFIKAMILPSEGISTDSLKGICLRIRELNSDADLSAQALCKRINDESTSKLLKSVYAAILAHMNSRLANNLLKCEALKQFNSVMIEDSTVMKLDEKLQEEFRGTNRGGKGAKSQVKIDLIYDLMKEAIVNTQICNGNYPDQGLSGRIISFIKPGDLVIRDLGYFALNTFQKIIEMGAFFLSRLPSHLKIYLNKDDIEPVDLGKYLEKRYSIFSIIDIPQVFVGDEKVPMRVVFYRLPKDVVEVRRREANKRAKETGRQISKGKRLLLQFAAFVTNIPKEMISAEVIGTIYRLRWEIELIFKRWKSQLKIDYLKGINKNRIECLIWSRLCSILIIEIINGYIERVALNVANGREISHVKVINYILRHSNFYKKMIRNQLEEFLLEMTQDILRMLLKDKRERKTMRERVNELESYYNMQPSDNQKVA